MLFIYYCRIILKKSVKYKKVHLEIKVIKHKMNKETKQKIIQKIKDSISLFLVFFKIGLFSFGGGYAMLSLFETEFVEKKKWLTHGELADIFAIAEATPGPIAINVATYVGNIKAGILGALFATFGVVLPAFGIIVGISYIINLVKDNFWVAALFKGLRVGVLVLILKSVISFVRDMRKDIYGIFLCIAAFAIAFFTNISVIYIILGALLLSILLALFTRLYVSKKYHSKGVKPYVREVRKENIEEADENDLP